MDSKEPNGLPWVVSAANISLSDLESSLMKKAFRDYGEAILEKEFG